MEDFIIEWVVKILFFVIFFVYFPWVCFSTAYFYTGALLAPFQAIAEGVSDRRDKRPKQDPIPPRVRRPKHLCGVDEACTLLGVPLETVKQYILEEKIKTFGHGGEVYLVKSDVKALIPKPSKRSKRSYPVVETFSEEHRITNPVEFTT